MDTILVQTVWQVMEKLRAANQLEDALSSSLDILREVTKSSKGSIWMLDDMSGRLISLMNSGTYDAIGESAAPGEGLVGEVFESSETKVYKLSEAKDIKLAGIDSPAITGKGVLCIPIKSLKHTIGCMLLF